VSAAFIPFVDFIPALSPRLAAPSHLHELTDVFQRIARGEPVDSVSDVAPRMGKTETITHGLAWLLAQNPSLRLCYATYSDRLAQKKSRKIRELAKRAGVPLAADSKSKSDWRTTEDEGGLWATSPGGSITGEGFDVIVIDDPMKGRAESESSIVRERTVEWFVSDVITRAEPNASKIVNGTRWHPEDLVGYCIGLGWEHIHLPALTPEGESLWPERWSTAALHRLRETMGGPDGYEWTSLYMGNPRGRGARVFGDVNHYDTLPASPMQIAIGLDFAYSARTSADWSVAVVLGQHAGVYYVLDVVRVHEEPRAFRSRVQLLQQTHGGVATAYAAATEMGGIEFVREAGIPMHERTATIDKFSRAIGVAAAWNQGKVLLPRSAPWLDKFVSEVCGFTGVKDRHDDQVDALAAAFDELHRDSVDYAELARLNSALPNTSRWSGYQGRGFG
jgi:predicted phage terminase large subunit-like protein